MTEKQLGEVEKMALALCNIYDNGNEFTCGYCGASFGKLRASVDHYIREHIDGKTADEYAEEWKELEEEKAKEDKSLKEMLENGNY